MNQPHKEHTCIRLGLLLLVGLMALTSATIARAQTNDSMDQAIRPFIESFDSLASNFGEMGFEYLELQDEHIISWRTDICPGLVEAVRSDGSTASAFHSISQETVRISKESEVLAQLPPLAQNGDDFTRFLDNEEEYLSRLNLSQNSRELVLQQAIRFRTHIANSTVPEISATMSTFSLEQLRGRVTVLCDESHSPAHNESTAGWKSWLWNGLELLGGTAVFAANLLADPEPITKAMSMYFGAIVAGNGYSGLSSLFRP